MAAQKEIICPNCGARNEQYGKCEYCGTDIVPDILEELEGPIHGKHQTNIDPRVLRQEYDKFEDKTETYFKYSDDRGYFDIPCYYEWQGEISATNKLLNVRYCQSGYCKGTLSFFCGGGEMIIQANKRNHRISILSHSMDEDVLYKICVAQSLEVRFGDKYFADEKGVKAIQLLAQVFYSTFYDENQFKEAADELYTLYESIIEDKKNKEAQEIALSRKKKNIDDFKSLLYILATAAFFVFLYYILH